MVRKQRHSALKKISLAGFLLLALVACDKVIPNPELLSSTNVTIEFSSDPAQVMLGESATLSWSVNDPDGVAKTVSISGGGEGEVVSLSSSMSVSPEASSVYYISVLNAENEVVKSGQTSIKVVDENQQEITQIGEVVSETVCDDGEDDEGDGLVDCLDSDCADDTVACPASDGGDGETTGGSFSVEPSYTSEGEALCFGDAVTVAWASDFDSIVIWYVVDGVEIENDYVYGDSATAQDNYQFDMIYEGSLVLKFIGTKDAQESAAFELPILTSGEEACAAPEFQGRLSVRAFPSKSLISGELYSLSWTSDNLSSLKLDGENVNESRSFEEAVGLAQTANKESIEHVFSMIDNQDAPMSDSRTVSLKSTNFSLASPFTFANGINKIILGESSSDAYVLSGTQVIHATSHFTAFDESVLDISTLGRSEDVVGYAKSTSGEQYFAIIDSGYNRVYFVKDGAAVVLFSNDATEQNNFVFAASDSSVLIGTNMGLARITTTSDGSCSEGAASVSNHCIEYINRDGDNENDPRSSEREGIEYRMIARVGTTEDVYLVTNVGVFLSTNGGLSFDETVLSDVGVQGLSTNHGVFMWSDSTIYRLAGDSFESIEFPEIGLNVRYVSSHAGRLFVGTTDGLYVKNALGWAKVLAEETLYMTFETELAETGSGSRAGGSGSFSSSRPSADQMLENLAERLENMEIPSGTKTTYRFYLITAEGQTATQAFGWMPRMGAH